ncbi:MAG: hypothetical protein ACJA2Q_002217 [Pseudohongiellaceae bacterium]|jgi:hypothetical protein
MFIEHSEQSVGRLFKKMAAFFERVKRPAENKKAPISHITLCLSTALSTRISGSA